MRKERPLPILARVLGVGAIGLAAACGGKMAKNETASQPPVTSTPQVESQIPQPRNVEEPPISQEANLIPDPSFESGDWRNNWVIAGKIITQGGYEKTPNYLSIDNTEAHSGASSLRMTFLHDLEDEYSYPPACERQPGYGFDFNSEIQLPPGFYEIGVWLRASPRIDEAWFSVGAYVSQENFLGFATYGADKVNGVTNWPSEWERLSAAFQVTEEVAQPFFQPKFDVDFSPARLPCGSRIDVWFDDIYLVPTTPTGQEVQVLKDPLAKEKFYNKLAEESRPLVERARALLPKMRITNDYLADAERRSVPLFLTILPGDANTNRADPFQGFLRATGVLINEYNVQKDTAPAAAAEFLNLGRDICFLMKEYFSKDFEAFTHIEGYSITNNPNCEFR